MVAVAAVAVHFVYRFIIEMTRVPRPSKSVPARAADPLITVINLQRCLINLIIEGLAFLVFLLLSPSSFFSVFKWELDQRSRSHFEIFFWRTLTKKKKSKGSFHSKS